MSIDINHVTEDMSTSNGEAPTMGGFRVPVNIDSSIGTLTNPRVDLLKGQFKGAATYENDTPDGVRTYVDAGIVYTAETNEMRFEDGGVLIEGTSQNEVLHWEDFSNVAWTKGGDVVAATDGTLSADGTTQLWKLTSANFSTAANALYQSISVTDIGQDVACSYEIKEGTDTEIELRTTSSGGTGQDYSSVFDATTGTFTTQHASHKNFFVDELDNGGYKIGLVFTLNNTGNTAVDCRISGQSAVSAYIYAIRGQIEDGKSYVTSGIATTTAAQSRSADKWSFPTRGNVPHPESGLAIMIDYEPLADGADMSQIRMFGSNDIGGSNYEWRTNKNTSYGLTVYSEGGFQLDINSSDIIAGEKARWLPVFQNVGNNVEWAIYKDGVPKGSGTVAGNISVPNDSIEVGYWSNDNTYAEGRYHAFRIYDLLTGEERVLL